MYKRQELSPWAEAVKVPEGVHRCKRRMKFAHSEGRAKIRGGIRRGWSGSYWETEVDCPAVEPRREVRPESVEVALTRRFRLTDCHAPSVSMAESAS